MMISGASNFIHLVGKWELGEREREHKNECIRSYGNVLCNMGTKEEEARFPCLSSSLSLGRSVSLSSACSLRTVAVAATTRKVTTADITNTNTTVAGIEGRAHLSSVVHRRGGRVKGSELHRERERERSQRSFLWMWGFGC